MRVCVYQAKPRLCMTSKEFEERIEDVVGRMKEYHSPDLIIFPECLGLWMCMMKPSSSLGERCSVLLPKHSSTARSIASLIDGDEDVDISEMISAAIQFSKPERMPIGPSSGDSLLGMIDGYESLSELSCSRGHLSSGWIEKVSSWVFDHLHLDMIGKMIRSKEQMSTYTKAFSNASSKYGVHIQAGSIFALENGDLYNVAYAFDSSGRKVCEQKKINPISFEGMLGVKAGTGADSFFVGDVRVGIAICADVNFKDGHVKKLADMGCELICCPSGGIVPSHLWKFDFERDIASSHLSRSHETGVIIARSYNAGDLVPMVLMFQGRSSVTGPSDMGENGLIAIVPEDRMMDEEFIVFDIKS